MEHTTAAAISRTANGSGSQLLKGWRRYCPNVIAIVAWTVGSIISTEIHNRKNATKSPKASKI